MQRGHRGQKNATLGTVEVDSAGETAVEVGRYALRGKGGQVADVGKYVVVWKTEGGGWRLHRHTWNTHHPAPSVSSEFWDGNI
jgi:ketosteroid isomerase-like protein